MLRRLPDDLLPLTDWPSRYLRSASRACYGAVQYGAKRDGLDEFVERSPLIMTRAAATILPRKENRLDPVTRTRSQCAEFWNYCWPAREGSVTPLRSARAEYWIRSRSPKWRRATCMLAGLQSLRHACSHRLNVPKV